MYITEYRASFIVIHIFIRTKSKFKNKLRTIPASEKHNLKFLVKLVNKTAASAA